MKRKRSRHVLVIRHSEIDQPGAFGRVMEEAGIAWHPLDPWQGEPMPRLEDYDAVLAMGGPQQADEEHLYPWLAHEKALLRDAVARGMPVLGVCLGCQLLADAHGGTVAALPEGEVGILDFSLTEEGRADPLFAGLPADPLTMQWHLNAVTALPGASGPARLLAGLRHPGVPAGREGLRRAVPHGGGRRAGAARRRPSPSTSRRWSASRARARSTAWSPPRQPRKRRCARTAAGSSRTSSA